MSERRLIVMRHAKSSWADPGMADHDRPLNERGREEAPHVARQLAELQWIPDMILSSDAKRTQETCALMCEVWQQPVEVTLTRGLYLAGFAKLLQEIPQVAAEVRTLLILGHNPGWEDVVAQLTGQPVLLKTAYAARLTGVGDDWLSALRTRHVWRWQGMVQGR